MAFAVWITGLPGSGKSTIGKELLKKLDNTEYLRLDEIRKKYVSDPRFTDDEREIVYSKFVDEGGNIVKAGKNVIYDATGNKLKWRKYGRSKIQDFFEVHIKCNIESCMKRESARTQGLVMADLYKKALERKRTGKIFEGLGKVVGVDVPFEEDPKAELVIDSEKHKPAEAADLILIELRKKGWI